jgi:transposase-like protein
LREFRSNYGGISRPPCPLKKRISQIFGIIAGIKRIYAIYPTFGFVVKPNPQFLNLCPKSWNELRYMVWWANQRQRREPAGRSELALGRSAAKEHTMSADLNDEKKKRQYLSPEKKYQIFLEAQRSDVAVAEILRREGLYATDLARIRQKVKEAALERLAARPGAKKKTVASQQYEALKQDLEEKERALAELAVEVAILRKKTNGGSWER